MILKCAGAKIFLKRCGFDSVGNRVNQDCPSLKAIKFRKRLPEFIYEPQNPSFNAVLNKFKRGNKRSGYSYPRILDSKLR
jgi:hypothetical protein